MGKRQDLTGQTINRWKVVEYLGHGKYKCQCTCEKHTERIITGYDLKNGKTKSCGCLRVDKLTDEKGEILKIIKETNIRDIDSLALYLNMNRATCYAKLKNLGLLSEMNIKHNMTKDDIKRVIEDSKNKLNRNITASDLIGKVNTTKSGSAIITELRNHGLENEIIIGTNSSQYENELLDIFPGGQVRDRKTLNGQEIDILYNKIGIEFNGNYWHSELYKDRKYHQDKYIKALQNGIQLISIFEYQWLNIDIRRKLINYINRKLGRCKVRKIYARNCQIKTVGKQERSDFLNKYHFQGDANSLIDLGIYEENELLGIMTFGYPRFNREYQYELIRLAFRDDVQVIGGSEKLFKFFVKKWNPQSIISYCDISKFNGHVYEKLGMKFIGYTDPSYVWHKNGRVLNRYQTMKSKIATDETKDLSESEIMHLAGYSKIYDCGNSKWEWVSNNK